MTDTIIILMWVGLVLLILGCIGYLVYQIVKKQPVIKIVWHTLINVIAIAMLIFGINLASGITSKAISCVKESCPPGNQFTYGQAFDNFLGNVEWKSFSGAEKQGDNGEESKVPARMVVEVNGTYTYLDEEANLTVQFEFPMGVSAKEIEKDSEFEVAYVGINDEDVSAAQADEILNTIFSDYASDMELPYEEVYFFGY